MQMKTWTISELIKKTGDYLHKKGIRTSRIDSELLLAHCLNKDRIDLYMEFESPVTPEELSVYRDAVMRRAEREPVAYILGFKEFWSTRIIVTKGVLIPRPETELLIEEAIRIIRSEWSDDEQLSILEIGTGSGAIPIAMAKEIDNAVIFSVDKSPDALKVARLNINSDDFFSRIKLVCGDSLCAFKYQARFDIILSNPPYIRSDEIDGLEPEVKTFEPREALDGGRDGLDFYRKWIPEIAAFLKKNGWLILEIGDSQAKAVTKILISSACYNKINVVKDYSKQDRIIVAQRK